jgi:DNA polymerase elongation subunit (family B)
MKLTLYNPSKNTWKEILDANYRPYFFVPHPLNKKDREIIKEVEIETKIEEKTDLFTGQSIKVTRMELTDYSDPYQVSKRFTQSWESEVPTVSSYVYDNGLTFGALHKVEEEKITPYFDVSENDLENFENAFRETKVNDPEKYELSKRWFILCSQPVPEVSLSRFGIEKRVDPEQYYLTFMLSRLANLPIPTAYSNRQVSTWIKSILYNQVRRKNILIPTSKELRRGETKKSVQGALTMTPDAGVHFNTVVVDFESLYPSLIDSYNLSYETIDCDHDEDRENMVPGLEHYVCTRKRGVYSVLIGSLKDLRIHWFKPRTKDTTLTEEQRRLAEATSELLKLILVSSYGVTVRMHGLARQSLAESMTAYGRYSLRTAWNIAKEGGLHSIYGDTDSLFLEDPSEGQIEWLIKTVKERLKLDLAVQERYTLCVLPKVAKAYFGIKKDGTADIKGVTAIKSNSPNFVQNVFKDCVQELARVRNQAEYVKAKDRIKKVVWNAIKDLKAGKVSMKDLEYLVVIHEDPEEKVKEKALHQPYQCAIQLIDSGKKVSAGEIMNFVKVKAFRYRERNFTVKPTKLVKGFHEINVEDYVRNLRTALNQTFKSMNLKFTDEEPTKRTLSDFL